MGHGAQIKYNSPSFAMVKSQFFSSILYFFLLYMCFALVLKFLDINDLMQLPKKKFRNIYEN